MQWEVGRVLNSVRTRFTFSKGLLRLLHGEQTVKAGRSGKEYFGCHCSKGDES